MKIILLGGQGSGKGTQGELIEEKYNIPLISMGELLREETHKGTKAGKEIEKIIDNGDLVPDKITYDLFKKRIKRKDAKKGYILDGFPRDVEQAEYLSKNYKFDHIFLFHLDDKIAIERISKRRTCPHCGEVFHLLYKKPKKRGICDRCGTKIEKRHDDTPKKIKHRLDIYHDSVNSILKYFDKKIKHKINANREINKIFASVKRILDK
jgi:adenylate kinase